ncbi:MAG TPA: PEP/pyruvate-binding domain-containing protein [Geobacteraceae bacterium]
MRWVIRPGNGAGPDRLGGKAGALAAMAGAGLPIPPWFALAPEAFRASLSEENRIVLAAGDAAAIRAVLGRLRPSAEVQRELMAALAELSPGGEPVAVRSSAVDEDGVEHSFAGQLESFLFVPPAELPGKVAAVWRSGFSERVMTYRRENGLPLPPPPPAVLVQQIVAADAAGVAFSADPVSGRRGIAVVSAVRGLGTALVSGECDADTWRVARGGEIIGREIAIKRSFHRPAPGNGEGVESAPLPPEEAERPCLTDDQVVAVAELARRAASFFGRPQDIEWAFEESRLYLLQSRPITSLAPLPDPDGALNIWDNSNIAESYGGVTTPLTFSFARHVYEGVYRQFCRIMAVPAGTIAANDPIFPRMLGLVRGRVYYNILNWYRLLAMLPGFAVNRRFMEQMMGVKEGIPDEVLAEAVATRRVGRRRDALNLAASIAGLIVNLVRLPENVRRFYGRLEEALAPPDPPLDELRPDELAALFRALEQKLLTRWDAPLVNDFFAMVFYGLLRRFAASWCRDDGGTLQNDLLCGEGGMVSAEPARRVREMAEIAAADGQLTELLATAAADAIREALAKNPQLAGRYAAYLEKFGDRCLDELKLESPTLHDDPLPLFRSVGEFARRIRAGRAGQAVDERAVRRGAEERVRAALAGKPVRRAIFAWVLGQARGRVRDRENLRFERTRLFGRVRRIFVELGKRLHADAILDDPRDVFYLDKDELFGFVEGTAVTVDLRGLAALRKREFDRWRAMAPPADRFETRGMVAHGQPCRAATGEAAPPEGDILRGIGCCPGIVRGEVRVITDPRGAVLRQGEILVAERTDPGWIMLFPACAGLLVERGSLLSHSAIVAREMGIPAIVALAGLTAWLKDGDRVEMDGATGVVRRITAEEVYDDVQ